MTYNIKKNIKTGLYMKWPLGVSDFACVGINKEGFEDGLR